MALHLQDSNTAHARPFHCHRYKNVDVECTKRWDGWYVEVTAWYRDRNTEDWDFDTTRYGPMDEVSARLIVETKS